MEIKSILLTFILFQVISFTQQSSCPRSSSEWVYEQATGKLSLNAIQKGVCYSGNGVYKNDPDSQNVKMHGPIPQGRYSIGSAHRHAKLGPVVMNLDPTGGQNMFGRDLFRIHGDSSTHPGEASDGCIVCGRSIRNTINSSSAKSLTVVDRCN